MSMNYDSRSINSTTSIVAALALFGVAVITVVSIPQQQAEAAGCVANSQAFNASKGRCFSH